MRFATPWLAVLFLATVSVSSSEDLLPVSSEEPEKTTENVQPTSPAPNVQTTFANNILPNKIRTEKLRQKDDNDLAPDIRVTMDDLLFFESLINDDKIAKENRDKKIEKSSTIESNPENPVESKISTDLIDIRRQGELQPKTKPGKTGPDIQFDDSTQGAAADAPPRFGLRKSKQKMQEEAPVLQLTEGGYSRPYRTRSRFRNRYVSRPDSSEQSSQVQAPDRNDNNNSNRPPETQRVVPQVTYSSPPLGSRPVLNPGFEDPRNMLAIHHVVPATIQSPFFNVRPTGLSEYTTLPFQAPFQNNEVGGFSNFGRDPNNNAALYQASQRNPFQTPGVMYQNTPEVQTQPILIQPARNVPPQFQANPFTPFPGYENAEDNSRPNYEMFFRNPNVNTQFQVPSNFYQATPNTINAFNSPPINFLSNYPNYDDRASSRFFRYPVATGTQNNQRNSNDQQPDSDASQENKNAKVDEQGVAVTPTNRDDTPTATFGTRLTVQNEADVYMKYPTNEAGYAIEENLPAQNSSEELKGNNQETNSQQNNFPVSDPFRNDLNLVLSNQRINNSFTFPPELFRDAPLDFGYQRPQSQVFVRYPDGNQGVSRYPTTNFDSRGPFDPVATLPENNYQFLSGDNQRRGHRESHGVPSCAEQNNASLCFEDNEYPGNDILYSLNSNSFLADRLSGQELPPNSIALVERNSNATDETSSEDYACAVDTKYGSPLRARNVEGAWRIIVNIQGKFSQPVRMEVCKSFGDPCNYIDSKTKTSCVQKYSLQRLLSWSPGRGIYSDVYKIPVACSCQILKGAET